MEYIQNGVPSKLGGEDLRFIDVYYLLVWEIETLR